VTPLSPEDYIPAPVGLNSVTYPYRLITGGFADPKMIKVSRTVITDRVTGSSCR